MATMSMMKKALHMGTRDTERAARIFLEDLPLGPSHATRFLCAIGARRGILPGLHPAQIVRRHGPHDSLGYPSLRKADSTPVSAGHHTEMHHTGDTTRRRQAHG
jgi:hypothetical protein